jgi:hypothetical protein
MSKISKPFSFFVKKVFQNKSNNQFSISIPKKKINIPNLKAKLNKGVKVTLDI